MVPEPSPRGPVVHLVPWALVLVFALMLSGCAFIGAVLGMGWPALVLAGALALTACAKSSGGGGGGEGAPVGGPPNPPPTSFPAPPTVTPISVLPDLAAGDGSRGSVAGGESTSARFGQEVAFVGDLNGDGYEDVFVGRPGIGNAIKGYVLFGRPEGFPATLNPVAMTASDGFAVTGGVSASWQPDVSSAGDVNGDGYGDLVIGNESTSSGTGQAWVMFGRSSFGSTVDLYSLGTGGFSFQGQEAGSQFGGSVAGGGDLNGDGRDDIVIGQPYVNSHAGATVVIFGAASFSSQIDLATLSSTVGIRIKGSSSLFTGFNVAMAGDVNGDGKDDLLIGTYAVSSAGLAYLVFGRAFSSDVVLSALGSTEGVLLTGSVAGVLTGYAVAGAGDVNGDGYDDVIVGEPGYSSLRGRAFVVFGSATLGGSVVLSQLSAGTGIILLGSTSDLAGLAVAGAGDVNADGLADVAISTSGPSSPGWARVLFGSAGGFSAPVALSTLSGALGFSMSGGAANDRAGQSLGGGGDLNGDGYDDLIIGAPTVQPSTTGAAYLVLGGNFSGAITQGGTSAGETIAGTSAVDRLLGGAGDDLLYGVGGADVLLGGPGTDGLTVDDQDFLRIDGGPGLNGLHLQGPNITWNLTAKTHRLRRIQGIQIDTGATLQLNGLAVKRMTRAGADNALVITGPADSHVTLADAWTLNGTADIGGTSFNQYQHGAYWLKIQSGIQVP